jgi:hypothetical protein
VGIRCAEHVTPLYPQKLALTSPTGGGRSVGIVRSRTKAMEFSFTSDASPARAAVMANHVLPSETQDGELKVPTVKRLECLVIQQFLTTILP